MKAKNKRTLVLNADYTPLSIISWKRAVVLTILNEENENIGARIVDFYKDDYIHGTNKKYPIPAVVVLAKYIKRRRKTVPFSRRGVYLRDAMTCQYCGYRDTQGYTLTIDHVIPRSKWKKKETPTNWNNIVTCCYECNVKKGNKLLEDCNMSLAKLPMEPKADKHIIGYKPWEPTPDEWKPYIQIFYGDVS